MNSNSSNKIILVIIFIKSHLGHIEYIKMSCTYALYS